MLHAWMKRHGRRKADRECSLVRMVLWTRQFAIHSKLEIKANKNIIGYSSHGSYLYGNGS